MKFDVTIILECHCYLWILFAISCKSSLYIRIILCTGTICFVWSFFMKWIKIIIITKYTMLLVIIIININTLALYLDLYETRFAYVLTYKRTSDRCIDRYIVVFNLLGISRCLMSSQILHSHQSFPHFTLYLYSHIFQIWLVYPRQGFRITITGGLW